MAVKKYDVVAITGEYTNAQGEKKKRYVNCGAVFETEKGMSLKLESLPVGGEWNGWLSLYEPSQRQREEPKQQKSSDPFAGGDGDEPLPF